MNHNDYKSLLKQACQLAGYLTAQVERQDAPSAEIDTWIAETIQSISASFEPTSAVGSFAPAECHEATTPATPEAEDTPEAETVPETEASPSVDASPSADAIADKRVDTAESQSVSLEEKLARDRARNLSTAFTLNDKFRFRRELFRNSPDEMSEALEVISQMSTLSEAEEYIYEDLCLDPANEDVKAFMDVVTKHF